jgi:hypothetical protein
MSLFPNILDISSYNTMLAQHQRLSTNHEHTAHNHHISEMVVDILSRVLAPASYLQCTSTIPCWAPSTTNAYAAEKSPKYVVDDDYVLLDDEEDGGPLLPGKLDQRRRRGAGAYNGWLRWLGGIRIEGREM